MLDSLEAVFYHESQDMVPSLNHTDSQLSWTTPQEDTDSPVIGLVQGVRATLMVDACSSHRHAAEVRHEMRAHGIKEPDYAVITHRHPDHWFGLIDFESTVAICSRLCLARTQAMTRMDWSHDGHRRQLEAGESYEMLDPSSTRSTAPTATGSRCAARTSASVASSSSTSAA
jgi:glyoxylase-like metal-dependent hydrolase (beta-lactamase superfamily II)